MFLPQNCTNADNVFTVAGFWDVSVPFLAVLNEETPKGTCTKPRPPLFGKKLNYASAYTYMYMYMYMCVLTHAHFFKQPMLYSKSS